MLHLMLMQFNLRYPRSDSWLRYRLEIFKTHGLACLKAQTCQNFKTIVAIHRNTPKWLREEFSKLENDKLEFKDVDVIRDIPGEIGDFELPLVTTRFDTDDIIVPDFMRMVQKGVEEKTEFLVFPWGYWYHENKVRSIYFPCNQFCSFVDWTGKNRSVLLNRHGSIEWHGAMRLMLPHLHMWAWVLHNQNLTRERQTQDHLENGETDYDWLKVRLNHSDWVPLSTAEKEIRPLLKGIYDCK